jgi:tetratricopeptide (TPR) repeat protein
MDSSDLLRRAVYLARAGNREEARALLLDVVRIDPRNEMAWIWLSGLVDSLDDQIIACENVLTINPANEKVRMHLAELQRRKSDEINKTPVNTWNISLEKESTSTPYVPEAVMPREHENLTFVDSLLTAEELEEGGQFEKALDAYRILASRTKDPQEFDRIYNRIIRIERLMDEKIQHVAPSSSIARLTFTWPLLYFSLVLIQVGLNPFANPVLYPWLGLPWVVLGGFLLAVSEVRSRHMLWQRLFLEAGAGSDFARMIAGAAGWFMVIVPHALLLLDSLNRLRNFEIPPYPLPW